MDIDCTNYEEWIDGPEDGDLVTEDHVAFYEHGGAKRRPSHVVPDGEDMAASLKAFMDEEKFWPDVWFLSDHGNYHAINLEGRR